MSSRLHDLVQAHLAVVALLESGIISSATRRQLEAFRNQLETDIADLRKEKPEETTAHAGLALWVLAQLAQKTHGKIRMRSRKPLGTVSLLEFTPSPRILIIEDHKAILKALVEMLSREFAVVGTAANGESGLAHALALNPDIIILDISLPDLNGLEVATRLRETGCGARVVFLSSCEDHDVIRAAFDLGASGYVFKSRIFPDLISTVKVATSGVAISRRLSSEGLKRHVW